MTRAWALIGVLVVAGLVGVCGSGSAAVEQASRVAMGGDDWLRDIWVMRADGSQPVRLTPRGVPDNDPAWSPDGHLIAYTSWGARSHNNGRIWVVAPSGAGRRPITPLTFSLWAYSPTWSPDGKRIAFIASGPLNTWGDLYVMNRDGTGIRRLFREQAGMDDAAWSPDGRSIVYIRRNDESQMVVTPAAGGPRRVIGQDSETPAWSPDGAKIAFSSGGDLFVMNAGGSRKRKIGSGYAPSWSPDGTRIATCDPADIVVVPAAGGRAQNLTKTRNEGDYNPAWSPDGRHIAFASTRAAVRNP